MLGILEELSGPYSSPLLYPLPELSSQLYDDDGSGPGAGEFPLVDDDDVPTLRVIPLVLGTAELDGFLSLLSLCLGLTALQYDVIKINSSYNQLNKQTKPVRADSHSPFGLAGTAFQVITVISRRRLTVESMVVPKP